MIRVTFADKTFIDVDRGSNLMSSIMAAGKPIGNSCSAIGICAKCVVTVIEGMENLSKPNPIERKLLEREKFNATSRISCLVKVYLNQQPQNQQRSKNLNESFLKVLKRKVSDEQNH
jgi:ferredoxin